MSKLDITNTINTFAMLGKQLRTPSQELISIIETERQHNAWFTADSVLNAILATGEMLNEADLTTWLNKYSFVNEGGKNVGLVLAGNIPLVGFHDVLSVLVSGNFALIKASTQDSRLIRHVLEMLVKIDGTFTNRFKFVERLEGFDAIIATGSNNTSRYFEYYFGKVPNIIRKNRNSIAVLTGNETAEELHELGHDIFDYFGLGCRNVSKLLVPEGYKFDFLYESIEDYKTIIHHHKYSNNYDYNKSIYLVNRDDHFDNGFLMIKRDSKLTSPLSVVFYDTYTSLQDAEQQLAAQADQLQCIVSNAPINTQNQLVSFGESQHPKLWDYADGVDTMAFLVGLS
ncbi:acyl-CoA reductase [Mucilaginibacter pallidiroseus]|uniref:Acyl-CoA reductase n=1 Tax=Mucilaginibacter pallidiroseus TaxID=2599295 RepID=A0A563UCM6_9SPHI|nr:acyl-CoA reductase [Mucilaginibacter pallidiroseus]TWR29033.1 acyl-CoA reductase [Mucilaginibacter pallidiroseus]